GVIGVGKGGTTGWPTQDKPAFDLGTTYTVTLDVDVAAHTYTATVNGGALVNRVLIADHEFRDVAATELNNLAAQIVVGGLWGGKPGDAVVSNIDTGPPVDDTEAPTDPANLVASNTLDVTTDLSWDASTDNVGVTGYQIIQDGTVVETVAATSATVTGLTAETTYAFTVKAVDAAGNESGASNEVSVTTLEVQVTHDDWAEISTTTQPAARGYGDMAALGNGFALAFSGSVNGHSGDGDNLTWVYDTETDTWTDMAPSGDVPAIRYKHSMAYAGDDKAIVFGGHNDTDGPFNDTWIYDYSENTWTLSASVPTELYARDLPSMAYIGDDKVLLFGGFDALGSMDDTWVYDVVADTWTLLAPAAKPSARNTEMAYAGDDKVLIYGAGVDLAADTWIFDLSDGNWTDMAPATNVGSRTGHGMAYLGEGNVLLTGGFSDGFAVPNDSWVYNVTANTWTEEVESVIPGGNKIVNMCETTMYGGGYIVSFGGRGASNATDGTYEFGGADWPLDNDPPLVPGDWTLQTPTTSPGVTTYNRVAHLTDGKVLTFGGKDAKWGIEVINETWVYDTGTDEWTNMEPAGDLPGRRFAFSMSHIGDDKVLLYNGTDANHKLMDTWVYDYSDNAWTLMNPATSPNMTAYGNMAYAGGDKAVMYGGQDEGNTIYGPDTWVYDLSEDSWTLVDTTGVPHPAAGEGNGVIYPAMTYFGEGKVLAYGGLLKVGGWSDQLWEFDVASMAWTKLEPTGDLPPITVLGDMGYLGEKTAILYGGLTGTYVYDGEANTWAHKDTTTIVPTFNRMYGMAGSKLDGGGELILFGGYTPVDNSTASNETWSYPQVIIEADTEAPTAPANLAYSNATETSVELTWDASTDNVGVVEYFVYQDGVEIATVTGTSATVDGLSVNVAYEFTVKAGDAAGNVSDASNTVTVTLVGIHDIDVSVFNIYPNPVSERLFISSVEEVTRVEIYSLSGSKLIDVSTEGQFKTNLDVSMLSKGAYLLYVTSSHGKNSQLFVKQ
ncbi:MAG: kelch repeat-containing protein, partial [Bacteroidota bacterium]